MPTPLGKPPETASGASGSAPVTPRILAVDDDRDIARLVSMAFRMSGMDVSTTYSVDEALRWVERCGIPDLGIFDMNMPGRSGLDLCRELHAFCDLPVLFLTVVDDEETVVEAFDRHAEDYVSKPFRPRELVARARRILRRLPARSGLSEVEVRIDDRLGIRFGQQVAVVEGTEVALTPTECKILHVLLRAAPRVVGTDFLLRRVWPTEEVFEDALRVHVHRLRQKIEPAPSRPAYLITHRGLGYAFAGGGAP